MPPRRRARQRVTETDPLSTIKRGEAGGGRSEAQMTSRIPPKKHKKRKKKKGAGFLLVFEG